MSECARCGICCHYYNDQGELKKCPQLVQAGSLTSCRIYGNRLGHMITKFGERKVICIEREKSIFDYPGCPYNTGKPMFGSKEEKHDNIIQSEINNH